MIKEYIRELEDYILGFTDGVVPKEIQSISNLSEKQIQDLFDMKEFILSNRNIFQPFSKLEYYDTIFCFGFKLVNSRSKIEEYIADKMFKRREIVMKLIDDKDLLATLYVTVPKKPLVETISKSDYMESLYDIACDLCEMVEEDEINLFTSRQIKYLASLLDCTKGDFGYKISYSVMNDLFKERFEAELNEFK